MKVCLSIAPATMGEARRLLKQWHRRAELVELRIDSIAAPDLKKLLRHPRPRVIVTNRRIGDGGRFRGSVSRHIELLEQAVACGADFVDAELNLGAAALRRLTGNKRTSRIIISHHDPNGMPSGLSALYRRARDHGADIVKIAGVAGSIEDNRLMFDLLTAATAGKQPAIALCMGEAGEISRILGGKFGAFLSFASTSQETCTAPGQKTYDEMTRRYRAGRINPHTRIFGLIGNPVRQSRGVVYHNDRFRRSRVNAVYVNFLVEHPAAFWNAFSPVLAGASVTMPWKREIVKLLDRLEGPAQELGIVNTVIRRKGSFVGMNTDMPALMAILKKRTRLKDRRFAVCGTGATAATCAFGLKREGATPVVIGRDRAKAKALADDLGVDWSEPAGLPSLRCDGILSTVPASAGSENPLVPSSALRPGMIVFDAAYGPEMTPLLATARNGGCVTISGLELFKRQALLQSQIFLSALARR